MPRLRHVALISLGFFAAGCKSEGTNKAAVVDKSAEPAPADAAKPEAQKPVAPPAAYRAALRQGRELVKEKKYREAADSFRRALEVVADDPRASSELSLALFRAGDLEGAKKAAEASIAHATGHLKAASLYNLGRVLEKKKETAAAIDAYRESLRLRPHEVVAKRLAKIGGERQTEPLAPAPWSGPFKDLAAFCASIEDRFEEDNWRCPGEKRAIALGDKPGPFKEAVDLELGVEYKVGHVLVRLESGWYASPKYYEHIVPGMMSAWGKVRAAEVRELGGSPVLRLDLEMHEQARFEDVDAEHTQLCGVAKGGALACTPPIYTKRNTSHFDPYAEGEPDEELETRSFSIDVSETGDIVVKNTGDKVTGDYRAQVGTHRLRF